MRDAPGAPAVDVNDRAAAPDSARWLGQVRPKVPVHALERRRPADDDDIGGVEVDLPEEDVLPVTVEVGQMRIGCCSHPRNLADVAVGDAADGLFVCFRVVGNPRQFGVCAYVVLDRTACVGDIAQRGIAVHSLCQGVAIAEILEHRPPAGGRHPLRVEVVVWLL